MPEGLVGGASGAVYADGLVSEQRVGVSAADCHGDFGGSGRAGTDQRCELYHHGAGLGGRGRTRDGSAGGMVVDAGD